jgi:hypothetical protein
MVIHSASDPRPRTTLCGDYFYNYFTRGLDILFDGQVFIFFGSSNIHIIMILCMITCALRILISLFCICRLIKSRSLFCIRTILVMQISIHT